MFLSPQLLGGSDFSTVKMQSTGSGGISLVDGLVLEFKFVIDSPGGTYHRVCIDLDNGSERCFYLAGTAPNSDLKVQT